MATLTLPILEAVDAVITKARKINDGIPDTVVVLGSAGRTKTSQVHGHMAPESWKLTDAKLPTLHEVMLSGESLQRGAVPTLGTILHELAHAYAHANKIKDTSNNGRYHNKKFKSVAETFGITLEQAETIGWSVTSVPDDTAELYADEVAQLTEALKGYRVTQLKASQTAKKYQMQCPVCEDPVTVTKKWFARNEFVLRCEEHDTYYEFLED